MCGSFLIETTEKKLKPWLKQHTTWKHNSCGSFFEITGYAAAFQDENPLRSCLFKAKMESWLLFHDDPPSEKYCIRYKAYHTTRYLLYLHLVDFWCKTWQYTTLEVGTSPNKDDVIWYVLLPKQNVFWCFCSIFVCDKLGFQGALHIYPTFYK